MTWKMKRAALVVTLVAALGPACKRAPETAAVPTATAERTAKPSGSAGVERAYDVAPRLAHPLLWSAEKAGKTTYLFGTMHAGIDAESRLPDVVWSKLDAAYAFAMEANLDDPQAASLLGPTGSSLRTALGDDYWKKLEDAIGPDMARAVEYLPPLVPAAQLSLRGLPRTVAMDKALSARALREHKPIYYLEHTTHQLEILLKWMDVKALEMMLDELPESEHRARAMLDAYVEGDDQKIVAISDLEKEAALQHGYTTAEYDQEMEEMLYGRNMRWIPTIDRLHAWGGAFVAVGALHLVGPRSVLELLARKGYQVKRVAP